MILYDGKSEVNWFYCGKLSFEDMAGIPDLADVTRVPCVLYDNADGAVYWYEKLSDVAERSCVPNIGNPDSVFSNIVAAMSGTYKAPGVAEAEAKADEAKAIALQAGTDPQLQALATLQVASMSFDQTPSDEVVKFIDYWPDWQEDHAYKHNDPITYQGRKFRVSKDLTSQAIYPPGTAESEYYEVTLAPDGIIVWYQPGGAYNQVYKGEKRHYPDAEGPVYEALEDTTYSPDTYPQHWKLVEE